MPRTVNGTGQTSMDLCWIANFLLALAGLVFSLYLGSAWYDRMLTSHVTKKVRKHIAASTKKD